MQVHKTPAVTATARKTRDLDADLLIIPVFEDDNLSDEPDLDRASGGEYAGARQRREFSGKPFEQLFTPLSGRWMEAAARIVGRRRRAEATSRPSASGGSRPSAGSSARQRRFGSIAIASASRRSRRARARRAGAGRGRGARQLRGDVVQDGGASPSHGSSGWSCASPETSMKRRSNAGACLASARTWPAGCRTSPATS